MFFNNTVNSPPLHPRQVMYQLYSKIEKNDDTLVIVNLRDRRDVIDLKVLGRALAKNTRIKELDLVHSIPRNAVCPRPTSQLQGSCSCGFAELCQDGLRGNTSTRTLNLSDNSLGMHGATWIRQGLINHPSLQTLVFQKSGLGDEGIRKLASYPSRHHQEAKGKVKKLVVNRSVVPPSLAMNLKVLDLCNNNLTCRSGTYLKHLIAAHSKSLSRLNLGKNRLGDDGCTDMLSGNGRLCSLEVLILFANIIGPEGAASLGRAIKDCVCEDNATACDDVPDHPVENASVMSPPLCVLRELHLGHNQLGDDGAVALASGLALNSSLRLLSLQRNQIGDAGAKSLAVALEVHPQIQVLSLEQNDVGNEGALALVIHSSHSSLVALERTRVFQIRSVYLQHNNVNAIGAQQIMRALGRMYDSRIGRLDLHFNGGIEVGMISEITFWTSLNRSGRRFLIEQHIQEQDQAPEEKKRERYYGDASFPLSLWPTLFAKLGLRTEVLHYFVREKLPGLLR